MSWASAALSFIFVLSVVYLLKLSNKIRLPAHLRLNVLQDARLSAISLPPRPTFRNRKRVAGSTSTFYAAAAFTRDRALRSFSRYENLARNELASKRRGVNDLRGRHARIATEIGYDQKLNRFRDAIHMNKNVTSAIVRHSVLGNTLDASGSIDGVCGAGTWTEDGPTDLSRVVEALKHCVRDWSIDALEERTHVFMPILSVLNQVPRQQRKNTKVLVPGAGLCRLAWEIARMGFDVTANEVSSYMTLPFRMLLDDASTPTTNSHTVCPHFSWFSHTRSNDSLFQSVSFPDILPRVDKDGTVTSAQDIENTLDRELGHFYIPGGKFELVESDFLALSSPNRTDPTDTTPQDVLQINPHSVVPVQPHDRGYDFIVTLFFIDTASNILAYLDQIHALLRSQRGLAGATDDYPNAIRSAGTWINLGPLLWPLGASLEPSLEEVLAMSERVGFDIIGERSSSSRGQTDTATTNPIETRRTLECQYTANRAGMMKWMYQAEFWVAKRQKD